MKRTTNKPTFPFLVKTLLCEYCRKLEATKQRVTGLFVCDPCDKLLTKICMKINDNDRHN